MNEILSRWLRWMGGAPCFEVYGKGRPEMEWRRVMVFATHRRDVSSRWPLWGGTCITWTSQVVAVGWDFAEQLLHEQIARPASRQLPVEVAGGRLRDRLRRADVRAASLPTASEILAHECGHTWQALRLRAAYLPIGAAFTLFREGPHLWNRFENQASELGQFGGIIKGSISRTFGTPFA
jgi:hypothetical protein